MNISYRTGLLEENSLFKKKLFAGIEFLIYFFCMTLCMVSYGPLTRMVSGGKSVFNLIDNPLGTKAQRENYFSLAVHKVISVFSFQKICNDISNCLFS